MEELTFVFARLKGLLLTEGTAGRAVEDLAEAVKRSIPGSLGAGVSLLDDQGRRRSTGYTDDVVAEADALQYDLSQGPCLTAWAAEATVQIDDVRTDDRWPLWQEAVRHLPLRSTLSTALVHNGRSLGALKVYSPLPSAFSLQDRRQLVLLASPAATLLGNVQPDSSPAAASKALRDALGTRDLISSARGVLMERHGLDADTAMRRLLSEASMTRVDLRTVALSVIDGAAGPSY
ncbi:GAF and ANTAR domain-containing protein [Arthrobacter sp. B0490]|uniref:GAF and ANTAR domain-containing protein n=1 Tax=Arthrobacter sp. B0490 TaxID=2058891 RepID=UPI000CE54639|nr:GAF and ANTAR domain-containing protein [Arthrobacter sp. B0490]